MKPPYENCLEGGIWYDDAPKEIYVCEESSWVAVMEVEQMHVCPPCPDDNCGTSCWGVMIGSSILVIGIAFIVMWISIWRQAR